MRVRFKAMLRFPKEQESTVDWDAMGITKPKVAEEYIIEETYIELESSMIFRSNPSLDGKMTNLLMVSGERITVNCTFDDYCRMFRVLDFDETNRQINEANNQLSLPESADVHPIG